jgi:hypothetical protein
VKALVLALAFQFIIQTARGVFIQQTPQSRHNSSERKIMSQMLMLTIQIVAGLIGICVLCGMVVREEDRARKAARDEIEAERAARTQKQAETFANKSSVKDAIDDMKMGEF